MDAIATRQLSPLERQLIERFQRRLPLCPRPYAAMAQDLGTSEEAVLAALCRLQATGVLSRVGGAFDFVSHCYRRSRHPTAWPYNLFAMVHGRQRDEVDRQVGRIRAMLGGACRAHDILYSRLILKKTGIRLTEVVARIETLGPGYLGTIGRDPGLVPLIADQASAALTDC